MRINVPMGKEYLIPWILGLSLAPILSALGSPAFVVFHPFQQAAGCLAVLGLATLTLLFDSLLLWAGVRSQFVTWETGRQSFFIMFAILLSFYIIAWGATLSYRGTIRLQLHYSRVDPCAAIGLLATAFAGLAPALGISAIWKFEDPGFGNIRLQRRNLLTYLDKLLSNTITSPEYGRLVNLAGAVEKEASAGIYRAQRVEDQAVLASWHTGAASIVKLISGFALTDLASLDLLPGLKTARDELDRRS